MKTDLVQPSLLPEDPGPAPKPRAGPGAPAVAAPAAKLSQRDPAMGEDDTSVHDTLCALQAPSGLNRLSETMAAAALRTERGSAFNPAEVRRSVDRLYAAGHVTRDAQARWSAAQPHAGARFRELMLEPRRAKAWFEAWRAVSRFDHAYSLVFQDEEQLAAAMRLVIYGGATTQLFQRLGQMAYGATHLWSGALRKAVLAPFDAELFGKLEPVLRVNLIEHLMMAQSGFAEGAAKPLEDWLLARNVAVPGSVSPELLCRLAETLLFRGDFAAALALCANQFGAQADTLRAALIVAAGQWQSGAIRFEAALKRAATETGRRKNLASPSILWLYLMALLAQSEPAAWTKARKFAASEMGKGGSSDGSWAIWLDAIDQRLGDAPKANSQFQLARARHGGMRSLQYLHHLLLAAWLRVEPAAPAELREHALRLAADFDQADLAWLARLARRAAALL
ncbi:MAG: hypothetical protein WA210_11190, partial [Burkholderiaceae bacterium]